MSTELAIQGGDSIGAMERTIDAFTKLGRAGLLPKGVQSAGDATIMAMYGARFNWGPIESLYNIHVIDGKPSLSSSAMLGVVLSHAECIYFDLIETTDKVATYETQRKGSERKTSMSYSIDQAKRAGLLNRGPWKQHPEDMLRHRCAAKLARAVYPDVLSGVYTPDEVHDFRNEPAPRNIRSAEAPKAAEPEHIEDAEVIDEREPDAEAKPARNPPMSAERFAKECDAMGLHPAVVKAWRTARKGDKDKGWDGDAGGFRMAGTIAKLAKPAEQLDLAAWFVEAYPDPKDIARAFAMVNGLTMGEAERVRDKMDGDIYGAWAVMGGVIERLQKGGE